MRTLSNNEDPDDSAVFHQGLNCLLRIKKKRSSEKYKIYLEIIPCDPSINTMDKFHISNQKEEYIRSDL